MYNTNFSQVLLPRNSIVPVALNILFFSLGLLTPIFPPKKPSPSLCFSCLLYRYIPCPYLYSCSVVSQIFFFTLSISSPPLSLNFDSWGMSVLLRLSYMHLMWHRLGKNPLINAEVRIFNLLVCSGSSLWSWVSSGNYT